MVARRAMLLQRQSSDEQQRNNLANNSTITSKKPLIQKVPKVAATVYAVGTPDLAASSTGADMKIYDLEDA